MKFYFRLEILLVSYAALSDARFARLFAFSAKLHFQGNLFLFSVLRIRFSIEKFLFPLLLVFRKAIRFNPSAS